MALKKCRVCGKEYEVCKTAARNPAKTFRWQEVACSIECGNEYFKRITKSREDKSETTDSVTDESIVTSESIIETSESDVVGDFTEENESDENAT